MWRISADKRIIMNLSIKKIILCGLLALSINKINALTSTDKLRKQIAEEIISYSPYSEQPEDQKKLFKAQIIKRLTENPAKTSDYIPDALKSTILTPELQKKIAILDKIYRTEVTPELLKKATGAGTSNVSKEVSESRGVSVYVVNLSKHNIGVKLDFPGGLPFGIVDAGCPPNPRRVVSPMSQSGNEAQNLMLESHCALKGLYINPTGRPQDADDYPIVIWPRGSVNFDDAEYTLAIYQKPNGEWEASVLQGKLQPDLASRILTHMGNFTVNTMNSLDDQVQSIIKEITLEHIERAGAAYATGGTSEVLYGAGSIVDEAND